MRRASYPFKKILREPPKLLLVLESPKSDAFTFPSDDHKMPAKETATTSLIANAKFSIHSLY